MSVTITGDGPPTVLGSVTAGAIPLNLISAATASNTPANHADFNIVFNWQKTTNSETAFTIGESAASTGGTGINQALAKVATLADSTATPFLVSARGAASSFVVDPTGKVGIGMTPTEALSITGNAYMTGALGIGSMNTLLAEDASHTLGMRNGANKQALKIYGTYTDAANYTRLSLGRDAFGTASVIVVEQAGSGSTDPLYLGTSGASAINFITSNNVRFILTSTGHLLANNNTPDIGNVASGRMGNIYSTVFVCTSDVSDTAIMSVEQHDAGTTAALIRGRKSRGTVSSPTVITTGDEGLVIGADYYVGATNTYQRGSLIKQVSAGVIADSATGVAGMMKFLAAKVGIEPAEILRINGVVQHTVHVGTAPTITAGGGTGPTIAGTDECFSVTIGTGGIAQSVTVTFANAYTVAPQCVANHQGASLLVKCVSTTTTVVITAELPFTASGIIDVVCRGYET